VKSTIKFTIFALLAALVLCGCRAREVTVMKDRYMPAFQTAAYAKYKDVPVFFDYVSNRAQDTVMFGYKDSHKRMWYMTDTILERYVSHAMHKAFRKVGMKVYDYRETRNAFELRIVLFSMTGQSVKFKLTILRDGEEKYDNELTASIAGAPSKWRDDEELQKYAFGLMDAMAEVILNDKEVEKVLLSK